MFCGRFAALGPSNHVTHDRILSFTEGDPDAARGLVSSHAEMHRNRAAMLAAIRYEDEFRRDAGVWRFRSRLLSFFYYVRAADYLDALGAGRALRNRAYSEPRGADWPESLPTWKQYYDE